MIIKRNSNLVKKQSGITLIALIVTIILLLILAGVVINFALGNGGIINRAKEAAFKTRMSALHEQTYLYSAWQVTKTVNTDVSWINAGTMLSDLVQMEQIDITDDKISFNIEDILTDISKQEKEYIAVYKGEMYYVSSKNIKNNTTQRKWCEEIGIKILDYTPPTGIVVINGNYELVNGIYLCTPKLNDGFIKEKTRYMIMSKDGNLVPGKWITEKPSEDWYDYKNRKWANIYVENNGNDCYYTWIPRYAFKLDQDKQKSDVKFIDVKDDSWIDVAEDGTETRHEWKELENLGYSIPEAFTWIDEKGQTVKLAGYWTSKYTLGELDKYIITYTMVADIGSIQVNNIKTNTTDTIAKYTYALNGVIEKESDNPIDYTFKKLKAGDNVVNITALNADGEIIGSMTKVFSPAIVNAPDLTGFNKDTTFYVTWDENQVEHSEIPITKAAPDMWYEYGARRWANIVTRNNGLETYYVWIPRYEFTLDQKAQTSTVNFIKGTGNGQGGNYQIPEAFSWVNEKGETVQIPGYWVTKYTLGDETNPRFDTEITSTSSSIKTKAITGSDVNKAEQKYMYYIDGDYKETKTTTDGYEYTGLQAGRQYTINIIIRNTKTEEYLGSITKQIKTIEPNAPDLTGFNKDITYYVTYDQDGNEHIGEKISNKVPSGWYDYSTGKWANIVVKTENATTYYTWIPRYEFKILSGQYKNTNQRTEVRFLSGITTETDEGYQIPEAFSWVNEKEYKVQLPGYWVTKYTLGEQAE